MVEQLKILVLASGGASTADAGVAATQIGRLPENAFVSIVTTNPEKLSEEAADTFKKAGVPLFELDRKLLGRAAFNAALHDVIADRKPNLIAQLGLTRRTNASIIEAFSTPDRMILNQHPADLDPDAGYYAPDNYKGDPEKLDFGGKGMHGKSPIAARLAYNWATGENGIESTLHIVSERYDDGPLLGRLPMKTPKAPEWFTFIGGTLFELQYNPEELKDAVKNTQPKLIKVEHENVIRTFARIAEAGIETYKREHMPRYQRQIPLIPDGNEQTLFNAKQLAKTLYPNG